MIWWFRGDAPPAAPHPWARCALATLLILAYSEPVIRYSCCACSRSSSIGRTTMVTFEDRAGWLRTGNSQAGLCPAFGVRGPRRATASSAVLQSNPVTKDLVLHMLYSGRDAAASDGRCGIDLAANAEVCCQSCAEAHRFIPVSRWQQFRRRVPRVWHRRGCSGRCGPGMARAVVVGLESEPSSRQRFCQAFRCGAAANSIQR